jgi:NAD(P)-dependent dehydrogenase (short-subunit alcohol dehydrogenase family)
MNLELDGKVVLVTGGSKGIGLACARAFGNEGARVAIVSRGQESLSAAQKALAEEGIEVTPFAADLSDVAAAGEVVAAAEEQVGPISVLVNSAGGARRVPPSELTAEKWRVAMDAKFYTYVNVIDHLLPRMVARRAGSIVNIIGTGGKIASPAHIPGGAANAALMLASAGLAAAWGHAGVRVNVINPGRTMTGRVQWALEAESRMTGLPQDELLRRGEAAVPLGRYATPEEIADAALYLSSARASYVTAASLTMDGALTPLIV